MLVQGLASVSWGHVCNRDIPRCFRESDPKISVSPLDKVSRLTWTVDFAFHCLVNLHLRSVSVLKPTEEDAIRTDTRRPSSLPSVQAASMVIPMDQEAPVN